MGFFKHMFFFLHFRGRCSSNVVGNVVEPTSIFVVQDCIHEIVWGHDIMGISESNEMRIDLMLQGESGRVIPKQVWADPCQVPLGGLGRPLPLGC